jgi:hypothetical protein
MRVRIILSIKDPANPRRDWTHDVQSIAHAYAKVRALEIMCGHPIQFHIRTLVKPD